MAPRTYRVSREEPDSSRLARSLQHHSRVLLEANRELKEATRARSAFISKMSHEFRATLNIIIGFTELMLDETPGPLTPQQRHCLNDILDGSRRLMELVNEYLEQPGREEDGAVPTALESR